MPSLTDRRKCHEQRAVFFDRDGTLNEMVYDETHGLLDSPRLPGQVRLMPGAAESVKRLRAAGFFIVVVTNQPGLAKGFIDEDMLGKVNDRLADLMRKQGAEWDALYFCPHHPSTGVRKEFVGECECRKPKPGMLLRAAREHCISLRRSWMIGDGIVDVQAGRAAGCHTVLYSTLKLEQIEMFGQLKIVSDSISHNFKEITGKILENAVSMD